MKILIVYATTEGQTGKICRFASDHLTAAGHSVVLVLTEDARDTTPEGFDAVILAASVHVGRYQASLVDYATTHAAALNSRPSLFLAVSLAIAGEDPDEHADLERIAAEFATSTGWTPGRVEQVAGAFRFGEYDFFKAWAMRWIERTKDPAAKPGTDREYTDWAALEACLNEWSASAAPGKPQAD